MPRQTSGASCIYDFPDMKGETAPDDIGLVEMPRSEIAGEDAPELEELDDDPNRIPPGRGSDEGMRDWNKEKGDRPAS